MTTSALVGIERPEGARMTATSEAPPPITGTAPGTKRIFYVCRMCGALMEEPGLCDKEKGGCGRRVDDPTAAGTVQVPLEFEFSGVGWVATRPPPELVGVEDRPTEEPHLTDMGNGVWFARDHRDKARYCYALKVWLIWDNSRWKRDAGGEAMKLAKATARKMHRNAVGMEEGAKRNAALTHGKKSESHRALVDMLAQAQSELAITPQELDRDPYLFNLHNCTIDLRTGKARAARPTDYLTKQARAMNYPDTKLMDAPTWHRCLDKWTGGNQEYKAFLQRAVALSLLGRTALSPFFIVHGPTGTGKTRFLSAIKYASGDYAEVVDVEALLRYKRAGNANDPEIAKLPGIRFVMTSEVGEGRKLSEAKLKLLTGGGQITSTAKYQDPITFDPQFLFWMDSNYLPEATGDPALFGRIIVLPFVHQIPREEQDPGLGDKLKAEASGILAWAIEKAPEVLRDGLGPIPEICCLATDNYRKDSDHIERWCGERIECASEAFFLSNAAAHDDLSEWWQREDLPDEPPTRDKLGKWLTTRGFKAAKGPRGVRGRYGLRLKVQEVVE